MGKKTEPASASNCGFRYVTGSELAQTGRMYHEDAGNKETFNSSLFNRHVDDMDSLATGYFLDFGLKISFIVQDLVIRVADARIFGFCGLPMMAIALAPWP